MTPSRVDRRRAPIASSIGHRPLVHGMHVRSPESGPVPGLNRQVPSVEPLDDMRLLNGPSAVNILPVWMEERALMTIVFPSGASEFLAMTGVAQVGQNYGFQHRQPRPYLCKFCPVERASPCG